jgi:hypothetical protein
MGMELKLARNIGLLGINGARIGTVHHHHHHHHHRHHHHHHHHHHHYHHHNRRRRRRHARINYVFSVYVR